MCDADTPFLFHLLLASHTYGCVAGWTGGTIVLVAAFWISVWTLWQLCKMHEINGKRMNRYHELGQYAFGEKAIH